MKRKEKEKGKIKQIIKVTIQLSSNYCVAHILVCSLTYSLTCISLFIVGEGDMPS